MIDFDTIQEMAAIGYEAARAAQGLTSVTFQDRDGGTVLTVTRDWMMSQVVSQAEGVPEIEINILTQAGVTASVLDDVRFAVLKGIRYEKKPGSNGGLRPDAPERHQLRFDAIGEVA